MRAKLIKTFKSKEEACKYARENHTELQVIRRKGAYHVIITEEGMRAAAKDIPPVGSYEEARRYRMNPKMYATAKKYLVQIIEMVEDGETFQEISKRLGIPWNQVRTIYRRYEEGLLDHLVT